MSVNHATAVFVDEYGNPTREWFDAMDELDEEVPQGLPHYHVVQFINGCLNDYDSGPIDTLDDARELLKSLIDGDRDNALSVVEAGTDRYIVKGVYILKIEECNEPFSVCYEFAEKGY